MPTPIALGRLLDDVVFHEDVIVGPVFQEDLGEIAAPGEGEDQRRPEVLLGQAEMVDEGQRIPVSISHARHYTLSRGDEPLDVDSMRLLCLRFEGFYASARARPE